MRCERMTKRGRTNRLITSTRFQINIVCVNVYLFVWKEIILKENKNSSDLKQIRIIG